MADVTAVVFTDGRRSYIGDTIASFEEQVTGDITRRVINNDSADPDDDAWLKATFPDWTIITTRTRQGFGGAISRVWRILAEDALGAPTRYVWHLEDDFTMKRPLDLSELTAVLEHAPHLVQLALRRQPWNDAERAAGGVVEQHPGDYTEHTDGVHAWLEHRRFFTTNPSLYRLALCKRGWPTVPHSEGMFSVELFKNPLRRCAFWGGRDSGEWVEHTGAERAGCGY